MARHGPHQTAQKSTSTGLSSLMIVSKLSLLATTVLVSMALALAGSTSSVGLSIGDILAASGG